MVRRHKRHLSQTGRKNRRLMELIKDFFENTSFSGLRYIFEPGRMIIERIFWIAMAAVSTAALLVVIAFLWTKFQNDPTIISLDTNSMVFNHPYMAFIICPLELRPYNDTNRLINRLWPNETLEGRSFLISFFETLMNISYDNIEPLVQFLGDRRLKGLSLQNMLLEARTHL
uniref:Uncharacterized protein n=1 Tax=Timema poppense TaxID=170557 RepID=A0A7R9GXH7_TIMPO|nr:unnamed protein product [Timema poppensis]